VNFYHPHWDTIGEAIRQAVMEFLNHGHFDPAINVTNIVLIQKNQFVVSVHDYQTISLWNFLYKILAKVLANKLKLVLPSIISQHQSAFVPSKLISDNILVAYEALHTMATWMKRRKGFMAIKLDMSKAYDRVEWTFLEASMCRLGFGNSWISLIITCISIVSYSILVNRTPSSPIIPSRGIRQGDDP
jgi:hypothetical protein